MPWQTRRLLGGLMAAVLVAQAPAGHGQRLGDQDTGVAPCQDFFQFANGGWLKAHPVPADRSTWGAFDEMEERNNVVLLEILEDAAGARAPGGSVPQKVGDFFAAGMDAKAIDRAGLSPLRPELARIGAVNDARGLASALAALHLRGSRAGFAFGVGQDDKRSTTCLAELAQGGLGLPDRDLYLKEDDRSREIRNKYLDYLTTLGTLTGASPALARARAGIVLAMERRLAGASMTRVERRDPQATYHRLSQAELRALAPAFAWDAYFAGIGLAWPEALLVRQPRFLQELSAMAGDTPPAQWRAYLALHLVDDSAPFMGPAFEQAHFDFHEAALNGTRSMSPRWKRVLRATDHALGESLGQMFVARTFSPRARARALELVGHVRGALRERIAGLEWMTGPTRQAALDKLDAVTVKIGYPDAWRDYAGLPVDRNGYLGNVVRAAAFEFRRQLGKLGRPVDRGEWGMTPATVNAYYNARLNEIVFPAGVLQPPCFDPEADDAVNYGGLGMVVGHELTHGFDDRGRQYDAEGNLRDWWADADRKAYAARTDLVVRQFDRIEALPGLRLDGRLTLGENLADLGGLKIAYAALGKALEGRPRPAAIDGFNPEQRFFLGFAQSWHFQAREEAARMRLLVDPHSPAKVRVNAPLANLPEFGEAFGCGAEGPKNWPGERAPAIW